MVEQPSTQNLKCHSFRMLPISNDIMCAEAKIHVAPMRWITMKMERSLGSSFHSNTCSELVLKKIK